MPALPESDFPTIRDLRDRLSGLIERGLGDLPVQIVIAPDSTMQALARSLGGDKYDREKPALMIELTDDETGRLPVSFVSTDRMSGRGIHPQWQ